MAVKKAAAPAKKAAMKKAATKKAPARRAPAKTKVGQGYECEICGLAVTVDEACGCIGTCDLICCDQPMEKKQAK